jgi:hypothetical protein
MVRMLAAAAALALICGCKPAPTPPSGNQAAAKGARAPRAAPTGEVAPDLAKIGLRDWLIGTWSFEESCSTDFIAHYEADGALNNGGEIGTWTIDGDRVTETISRRFESGGEEPVNINPPETRSYRVIRTDSTHGVIVFERRGVRMQRC